MFELIPKRTFLEDLKKTPKPIKEKLKPILGKLKDNPFSIPYKKLKGKENLFRIRIGDYRLIYSIDKKKKKIYLIRILHRQKAYKTL